jgi:hypothetical protein
VEIDQKVRGKVKMPQPHAQVIGAADAEDANVRLGMAVENANLFGNRRLVNLLAVHELLSNFAALLDLPHSLLHRSLHSMLDDLARLLLDL